MELRLNLFLAFFITFIGTFNTSSLNLYLDPYLRNHKAQAAEVFNLSAIKRNQLLQPFIGSYFNYETDELGSLFVQDNKIQFIYNSKSLTYFIFNIPMDFENLINNYSINYSTDDLENGTDEVRYALQDSIISKLRITENKNRQIVETLTINLTTPGEIEITHSRKYYVRKGLFFKIWVIDETDAVAVNDSFEKKYNFKKTSSIPFTEDYIAKLKSQTIRPKTSKACFEYLDPLNLTQ